MEQLTAAEWAREQVKRAPSFAIATAIMAAILIISMFVEISSAQTRPKELPPVVAQIEEEEPPPIEQINEKIQPDRPDVKVDENAPVVEDQNAVPIDAPQADVTTNVDFTEDATSDALEATDPFPMDMTKKMAVIGTEPGSGGFRGALGNRTKAGKRTAGLKFGMPKGTDKAILEGLRWLKRTQEKDGHWDSRKWGGGGEDCAVTGLALLAFLGFGCTDKQPAEFANTVEKAIDYLVESQEKTGDDTAGSRKGWFHERMYTQGICTMALAEAYAMMGKRKVKDAAQMALDYIFRVQSPNGGFGYGGPGNDNSVSCFQLQAVKAGYTAGLVIAEADRKRIDAYLERSLNKDYSSSYQAPPEPGPGPGSPSMTSANLTARLFMGHKRTAPDCVGQAEWFTAGDRHIPIAKAAQAYYTIYYASLAMFNMGGKYWKSWNENFNDALRKQQVQGGPDQGSWPDNVEYGRHGGKVYTTSMACLALEVYYRYLPTYKLVGN